MSGQRYQVAPAYTGLQIQTSSGVVCVPLCWGEARGAPNLIWYGDFSAKAQHAKFGKGAGPTTGYDYHASLMMALCQGPIHGIGKCWVNSGQAVSLSQTHFSLVSTGTTPQAPWSYLVSNFPTQADAYNGVAIVATIKMDLGASPFAPSTSYEVQGLQYGTAVNGIDADCALVVEDFLSGHYWSVGIPSAYLDNLLSTSAATTTGDNAYQTYCKALGFGFSPFLQNQEQALTILDRWTSLTNTAVFWSGYSLRFVPYGDQTITANGVTYLPNLTPAYTLTDADFVIQSNADPIKITRKDPADCYNSVRIEISDRGHFYDKVPVSIQDVNLVQLYGLRQDSSAQADEVCDALMAATMVELMLNRVAYIRNTYKFELPECFCLLEPMDVLACVDSVMGSMNCRITSFEETEQGTFQIEAEELTVGLSSAAGFTAQTSSGQSANQLVAPASVNTPIIFEPTSQLAAFLNNGSPAAIGVAVVSGGTAGVCDPNWGGCNVYISTDGGTTYGQIGSIQGPARQGLTTANLAAYGGANPDTTNTLSLNMAESDGALASVSLTDAANGVTVSYCGGEILSYETATLTGANAYNLTTLYRGLYGTSPGSHTSGAAFARLDNSIFKFNLPSSYIGASLFLKFQSFNVFGLQPQDLSTCTAYAFTPVGTGYGGGTGGVPTTPTGLTVTAGSGQNQLAWTAGPASDNLTSIEVFRANGTGASFGSASLIATLSGNTLSYTDAGLPAATGYTYFLKAENAVGASANTAGVNATTSSAGASGPARVIQASENLSAGAFVNIWTSSGAIRVRNANATDDTKPADGFVTAAVTSGQNATVLGMGQQNTALSGMTPGTEYYLDTTAGGINATAPSASGNYQQPLGKADTVTALTFVPGAGMGIG